MEAYENYPELFVPTKMLYIHGEINNRPIEIFVDTGAQTTIISKRLVEKCGLMKDLDHRLTGMVVGVGTQRSLGKIWKMFIKIKGRFFVLSATVLQNFDHDLLLGLDMMKRHHCVIDLFKMCLIFGRENVQAEFINDHNLSIIQMQRQNSRPGVFY